MDTKICISQARENTPSCPPPDAYVGSTGHIKLPSRPDTAQRLSVNHSRFGCMKIVDNYNIKTYPIVVNGTISSTTDTFTFIYIIQLKD